MRLLIQSPWTKAPIDLGVITAQQAVNVQSKELSAALFPGARINLKLTLTNSFELKVQRAGGKKSIAMAHGRAPRRLPWVIRSR